MLKIKQQHTINKSYHLLRSDKEECSMSYLHIKMSCGERGKISSVLQNGVRGGLDATCEPRHTDRWGGVKLKVSSWMPDGIPAQRGTQVTEEMPRFSRLSFVISHCATWWARGEETLANIGLGFVFCNVQCSTLLLILLQAYLFDLQLFSTLNITWVTKHTR